MTGELFKINISTDIMVYAQDAKEAVLLAQQKAVDEVGAALYSPIQVKYTDEVPVDWLEYIPYCPVRMKQIGDKCKDMVIKRVQSPQPLPINPEPVRNEPVRNEPEISNNQTSLNFNSFVAGRRRNNK